MKRPVRKNLATLAAAVALTIVAATAWAYWSAGSVAGGGGAAAATSVNQGATPTANSTGSTVTVSWAATTLANGQAVSGYLVKRYDAGTHAAQTILSACTGTIATTSCVESNVPNGSWKYTVTPVFATSWQGLESAKSTTLVVNSDSTPPTNAVSLSSVTGGAYLTGTTVYYRGVAAGSLRLTNAVADAGSGPASSSTAALTGATAGWTHTPSTVSTPAGGPYVSNQFGWTAGTTSGPGEAVTGSDVAGNTAVTNLTFTDDSTRPDRRDHHLRGRLRLRALGERELHDRHRQRFRHRHETAPAGGRDPQRLGLRHLQRLHQRRRGQPCVAVRRRLAQLLAATATATSSPTASATRTSRPAPTSSRSSYAGAIGATPGLLSHWRLGEATAALTVADSFTGTSGSALAGHAADIGGTWVHQAGSAEAVIDGGRVRRNLEFLELGGYSIDYVNTAPASADYSVEADLDVVSNLANDFVGVIGRLNTANTSFYMARWEQSGVFGTTGVWRLVRYSGGTATSLAVTASQAQPVAGEAYRLKLRDDRQRAQRSTSTASSSVSATDATITAAGRAGIMDGENGSSGGQEHHVGAAHRRLPGHAVDLPPRCRRQGHQHRRLQERRDAGGTRCPRCRDQHGRDVRRRQRLRADDEHAPASRPERPSVPPRLWFKTSSAARQVLFRYGSGATTQEYGLWIDAGGATMTAWGWGTGNDKVFTMPSAVNNGAWHQVVMTYNGTSLTLYIDGVALAAQAATRGTAMDMYGFGIGAIIRPGDGNSGGFFTGSIDEVSFYTSVLNQTQVTDHYQLGSAPFVDGAGPTGGSIDATGLAGTGSRYATSTTLSLALAKGTDPSGVATSGNQVLRATATLAGGTCGTFGGYSLVAGGSDPASPLADTVADQACYSYQYVVLDTVGNATTYTSPDIKVDTTAPSAPTLAFSAFTNTWWPGSGSTVYYRSAAASGSVTATGTATDSVSGVASYAFPALGTNWTSTPGALGVNTYSWSGSPAAPGTKNVTATNNAGLTSANSPFTMTADDTAPTAGTVTYASATQTTTTVSVGFTTGTDAGSGIASKLLQRASATLTDTTCGTYGGFATISGGTNPASSPVVDTVTAGSCYQYRYVVTDNVGNQHIATSANVVKVSPSYFDLIWGTSGLVSYYRLGETAISTDNMTDTTGTTLQVHTHSGGAAGTWTKHASSSGDAVITNTGLVRKSGTNSGALYYASGVPATADYSVEADIYVASEVTNDIAGVVGRLDTSNTNGTYYVARYEQSNHQWNLHKVVNGTWSFLGSAAQTVAVGSTYRLTLDMTGTSIRVLVNGTPGHLRYRRRYQCRGPRRHRHGLPCDGIDDPLRHDGLPDRQLPGQPAGGRLQGHQQRRLLLRRADGAHADRGHLGRQQHRRPVRRGRRLRLGAPVDPGRLLDRVLVQVQPGRRHHVHPVVAGHAAGRRRGRRRQQRLRCLPVPGKDHRRDRQHQRRVDRVSADLQQQRLAPRRVHPHQDGCRHAALRRRRTGGLRDTQQHRLSHRLERHHLRARPGWRLLLRWHARRGRALQRSAVRGHDRRALQRPVGLRPRRPDRTVDPA